jgi:predicted O-methyltransferase YrrM
MSVSTFEYCPVLASILTERKVVDRTGTVCTAGSLSTANNIVVIRNLMMDLKPARTLEIGLAFGGSALAMTASHRDLGRPAGRQHTALDPFQATVWKEGGLYAVERAGRSEYLDFRPEFSHLALPELVRQGAKFDLVYIDGSHIFEDVFIDWYYVNLLLTEGGVVLFDDSSDPHVAKVLKFLRKNMAASYQPIDLGRYRHDGGTSLRYRVGAALGRVQLTGFKRVGEPSRPWNAPFTNF